MHSSLYKHVRRGQQDEDQHEEDEEEESARTPMIHATRLSHVGSNELAAHGGGTNDIDPMKTNIHFYFIFI